MINRVIVEEERQELKDLERYSKQRPKHSPYYPDDCTECNCCGNPAQPLLMAVSSARRLGHLCDHCDDRLSFLRGKYGPLTYPRKERGR
jgi:hypothetical protein